ncbi:hypothetical protein Pcinc_006147 [Petrolisthes cinctipes]|uniref:Uncharacterized protein n=1 Tax=Petrolisthes cinctipes TaxID=88211 RepID=A0AAE1GB73_PETCI|nr:hypothetical protein Pcinc_006147 [Petrolisthes cinctipes]
MNSRDVDYVDSIVDKVDYRVTIDKGAPSTVTQADLESLYQWAEKNNMMFSGSKFEHMSYTVQGCNNCPPKYTANDRYLRDCNGLGLDNFKRKLDKFLGITPDEPKLPQYHLRASSNSIVD